MSERHTVVVNMTPPSHKHIFLNSTNLAEYLQMVTLWTEWQARYGIKLETSQVISTNVKHILMYKNDLTDVEFNELTPVEFCKLMAKETIVTSKREFADTLRGALRNTSKLLWSDVRPNTHEKFIQGTLKRYKLYVKAFQIIMEEDGNKKFCPDLEGKDYGLVQIFLDMFEYSYVKTVLAEIPRVKSNKYRTITEFLDTFVAYVNEQYQASRALRSIPYEGADFAQPVARANHGRGEGSKPWQSGTEKKPWSKDYVKRDGDRGVLNAMGARRPRDSDDSEDERRSRDEQQRSRRGPDSDDDSVDPLEPPPDVRTKDKGDLLRTLDGAPEEILQALDAATQTKGCLYYTVYGKCFRGEECKNVLGHTDKIARETRQWLIRKLTAMENEGSGPPKLLTRERTHG